jgi:hypothetical protein
MKHLKLKNWVIWVSTMVLMGVTLFCKKSDDNDNKGALALLLASASVVPTTGPGCDRTKKECVISLMAGKTWYMVGPSQQPTNLLGFRPYVVAFATCYAKTKAVIQVGSGTNDLVFTVANVNGTRSNPDNSALPSGDETCDRNTSVGGYGSDTTSDAATITPVSESCFNIDITYGTIKQEGRGTINKDGTELRLEVYRKDNANPAGHRCADGGVGERNASLRPNSPDCNPFFYVCNPASDPTYNNVQIYDLGE